MRGATTWVVLAFVAGCGASPITSAPQAATEGDGGACATGADVATLPDGRIVGGPYVSSVVSFTPGPGAGFGASAMPDVVRGPPQGAGDQRGGTDVVSLGRGGEIVLAFDGAIVDQPGPDFTVFENPFIVAGTADRFWEELGEVSVSDDGTTWTTFPCAPSASASHPGCAGWNPVYANPADGLCALDPRVSGGDSFDLADVHVAHARFVRIRDLATQGLTPPSTGFDLDAVAVLHLR